MTPVHEIEEMEKVTQSICADPNLVDPLRRQLSRYLFIYLITVNNTLLQVSTLRTALN